MKKLLLVCLSLVLVLFITSFAYANYVETFDTDSAGFIYGYGTNFTPGTTSWNASGGNPDGYISGVSSNLYSVWTTNTSPYGDITGQTLTIDTMVTDSETGTAQFYVGRGDTFYVDGTWDIGADTDWTTHTAVLNSANFTPWTGGPNGSLALADVLQAPTEMGIFFSGATASGSGNFDVDNFGTVPIPGALWLLGSGLIGIVGVRRKLRS
jgi:hypothetical protein